MPNIMGGVVDERDGLRAELGGLLASFPRLRMNDQARSRLVEDLLDAEALFSLDEPDMLKESPFAALDAYASALEAAREAYFRIPSRVREVLPLLMPYTGTSMLSGDLLRQLGLAVFDASVSAQALPAWRSVGVEGEDYWTADLELLDLLQATARKAMTDHYPKAESGTRPRSRPDLILACRVIGVCACHGIKASPQPKSYCYRIIHCVIRHKYPKSDYRDLIKQAIQKREARLV